MYYLMIKKAYPSGFLYLCQTKRDPYTYKGSGLRWENHIKMHRPHIITCVIGEYETMDELREAGIKWSRELNVVESEQWANLREEDGTGGGSGKVGRRWKIKDTSNMSGPKAMTQKRKDGYARLSKEQNYQFKGWYVTPWGQFATLRDAVKEAKKLRDKNYEGLILSDGATIRRYCCQAKIALPCAPRVPKERQGKKPFEFGFDFIEKNDDREEIQVQ